MNFSAVEPHQLQQNARGFEKENPDPTMLCHRLSITHQRATPAASTKTSMKILVTKVILISNITKKSKEMIITMSKPKTKHFLSDNDASQC